MPKEYEKRLGDALSTYAFAHNVPEPIGSWIKRRYDRQSPFDTDFPIDLAKLITFNPLYRFILEHAKRKTLPDRQSQEFEVGAQLMDRSRFNLALVPTPPTFPDIPWPLPPPERSALQTPSLLTPFNHPKFGLPDGPPPWWLSFAAISGNDNALDQLMIRQLYTENIALHTDEGLDQLNALLVETAESQIPIMSPWAKDTLRFLGLNSPEEFIEKVQTGLFQKIADKMSSLQISDPKVFGRLQEFMNFARESDNLRTGGPKRKTGEVYYCHYLSSAWLLWTMIEDDVKNENDVREAIEDVETMFIHDLPEDLPKDLAIHPSVNSRSDIFTISLAGIAGTLTLSRDQSIILSAMTKTIDDGRHWLEKILNIKDPLKNNPANNLRLLRRAARCKMADRLSNLLTMTAAGGSYLGVIRKLDETVQTIPLQWRSRFADKKTMEIMDQLLSMAMRGNYVSHLAGVALQAEVEKQVLLHSFGQEIARRINQSDAHWAQIIRLAIAEELTNHGQRPPWQRRKEALISCYQPPEMFRKHMMPADDLHRYVGLEHLARSTILRREKPAGYKDLLKEFEKIGEFLYWMAFYPGVAPGGIDTLVGVNYVSPYVIPHFLKAMEEIQRSRID